MQVKKCRNRAGLVFTGAERCCCFVKRIFFRGIFRVKEKSAENKLTGRNGVLSLRKPPAAAPAPDGFRDLLQQ